MSAKSYGDIEAGLDRLLDSTEQVLQRMQQVMRGDIAQEPQIMARTLLETLELMVESQKATKDLLALVEARTS